MEFFGGDGEMGGGGRGTLPSCRGMAVVMGMKEGAPWGKRPYSYYFLIIREACCPLVTGWGWRREQRGEKGHLLIFLIIGIREKGLGCFHPPPPGTGVRRIGAGACQRGGRHHRREEEEVEEEEENNIPWAQPAPGGKSQPGVWELGKSWSASPQLSASFLSPCALWGEKLKSCFSQLSSLFFFFLPPPPFNF